MASLRFLFPPLPQALGTGQTAIVLSDALPTEKTFALRTASFGRAARMNQAGGSRDGFRQAHSSFAPLHRKTPNKPSIPTLNMATAKTRKYR